MKNQKHLRICSLLLSIGLACLSLAPTWTTRDYVQIVQYAHRVGKECKNVLFVTDLDEAAVQGTRAYRDSHRVLPFIADQMPGSTVLGLTARSVTTLDPVTLDERKYPQTSAYYQTAKAAWNGLAQQKRVGPHRDIWRLGADKKTEFRVGTELDGPYGATLSQLKAAFPEMKGDFSSHFSFPVRSEQYWYVPQSSSENPVEDVKLKRVEKFSSDGNTWVKLDHWQESGRLVGYWNGIISTSSLDKGVVLKQFLAAQREQDPNNPKLNFDCIFFADDDIANINSFEKAFAPEEKAGKLHLFHFAESWIQPPAPVEQKPAENPAVSDQKEKEEHPHEVRIDIHDNEPSPSGAGKASE